MTCLRTRKIVPIEMGERLRRVEAVRITRLIVSNCEHEMARWYYVGSDIATTGASVTSKLRQFDDEKYDT